MNRFVILSIFFLSTFFFNLSVSAQGTTTQKTCVECHKKTNAKTYIHEPSKESCNNCHKSNGKPHPSEDTEGFKLVEEVPQLCYSCHDQQNTKKTIHPPVKRGNCLDCHEVHSSNEKKLIFAAPPDLCFFCHGDMEKKLDSAKSIHHIIKKGQACINCHSPHQSNEQKLLVITEKELCLKCHDKPVSKDQRTIANIKSELDKNKYVHSAILKNGCSGCHDPHMSVQNNLLKEAFATSTYVSGKSKDSISLCFKCHNSALLEKEKASDATGFRNGDQNLHFKHLNKAKGRNCVNCHGIHSAPNEFLLVAKVKFGQWDMPLTFEKTEAGGKCITACHAAKTYSRILSK